MNYDENSFLMGITVGRSMKGVTVVTTEVHDRCPKSSGFVFWDFAAWYPTLGFITYAVRSSEYWPTYRQEALLDVASALEEMSWDSSADWEPYVPPDPDED